MPVCWWASSQASAVLALAAATVLAAVAAGRGDGAHGPVEFGFDEVQRGAGVVGVGFVDEAGDDVDVAAQVA